MPKSDLEEDTIILLDWEFTPPCEGTAHPNGTVGHIPGTSAAFAVISPCMKGPKVLQCAGRVAHMRSFPDLFCSNCNNVHPTIEYGFIPIGDLDA